MNNKPAVKSFVLGTMLGAAVAAIGFQTLSVPSAQAAPQNTTPAAKAKGKAKGQASTAPCGPNIQGPLGVNTAKDSRCFELRFYTVDPSRDGVGQFKGGINELHKRFREGELEVFKKNGVDVMAVWQSLDDPNTLVYLLSYKDRAAREAGWAAFGADPKWTELRTKYFVPLTTKITYMSATDYSPMK